MRQELYLDGQRVDIGSADISLKFVNNMLTAVDKFSSSYSYTITIPRTARNEKILGLPSFASSGTALTGRYIEAEYYRDGFLLTRNARAYITDTDAESIKIALIWDNLAKYAALLNEDPTVADLGLPNPILSATADDGRKMAAPVYQATIQTPAGEVVRPCLNFGGLVTTICARVGIEPPAVLKERYWAIPCTKMDGGWQPSRIGRYIVAIDGNSKTGKTWLMFTSVVYGTYKGFLKDSKSLQVGGKGLENVKISFPGFRVTYNPGYINPTSNMALRVLGSSGTLKSYTVTKTTIYGTDYIECPAFEFETNADTAGTITFEFSGLYPLVSPFHNIQTQSAVEVYPEYKSAEVGTDFYLQNNAPDLSQIDILKAYAAMSAMALVTTKGVTRFSSLGNLSRRDKGLFYDWTDKVANWGGVPKASHKVGNYARKNIAEWAADSKNGDYNPTAAIYAQSEYLKAEASLFKLPFAASKNGVVECYIKDDSGKTKAQETKPRILKAVADETTNRIRLVDDPTFDIVQIVKNYSTLAGALKKPVTITAYLHLTAPELAALEMDKAVYLEQTGRFYMIDNIKMDNSTDVCEAELVQLEN